MFQVRKPQERQRKKKRERKKDRKKEKREEALDKLHYIFLVSIPTMILYFRFHFKSYYLSLKFPTKIYY